MLNRIEDYINFNKFLKGRVPNYDSLYEEYRSWRGVVEMIALHMPEDGRMVFKDGIEIDGYEIAGLKLRTNLFSLDPWDIAIVTRGEGRSDYSPIPYNKEFADKLYKAVLDHIYDKK